MKIKLYDAELEVMKLLWKHGDTKASDLTRILEFNGWAHSTAYTIIRKCVRKGYIKRIDPGFVCRAVISKQQVFDSETQSLIERLCGGSRRTFMASFMTTEDVTEDDVKALRKMIEEYEQKQK